MCVKEFRLPASVPHVSRLAFFTDTRLLRVFCAGSHVGRMAFENMVFEKRKKKKKRADVWTQLKCDDTLNILFLIYNLWQPYINHGLSSSVRASTAALLLSIVWQRNLVIIQGKWKKIIVSDKMIKSSPQTLSQIIWPLVSVQCIIMQRFKKTKTQSLERKTDHFNTIR